MGGRRIQHHEHHISPSEGLQGLIINTVVLSSSPKLLKVQRSSGRVSVTPRKGLEMNKYMHCNFIIAIIETFSLQECSNCIISLPFPAIITSRLIIILELDCKDLHYSNNKFLSLFIYMSCFLFAHKEDFERNGVLFPAQKERECLLASRECLS